MMQFNKKNEAVFAAVAFAEAGEVETARFVAAQADRKVQDEYRPGWITRMLNAVAFAEAAEFDTARGFLDAPRQVAGRKIVMESPNTLDEFIGRVGLQGVRLRFGLAHA